MGVGGKKFTILGVTMLTIILASSSGFSFDNNISQKNSVESIPDFATAFVQFASATHVDSDATGAIVLDQTSPTNANTITGTATLTAVNDLQAGSITVELKPTAGGASLSPDVIHNEATALLLAEEFHDFVFSLDVSSVADGDYVVVIHFDDISSNVQLTTGVTNIQLDRSTSNLF